MNVEGELRREDGVLPNAPVEVPPKDELWAGKPDKVELLLDAAGLQLELANADDDPREPDVCPDISI